MKNIIITSGDVIIRIAFAVLATYLIQHYHGDTTIVITGYSMLIFNILTTFFDTNYHKQPAKN